MAKRNIELTDEQKEELIKQRFELIKIRASGSKQVTHGDKTIVFKSDSEIDNAIEEISRILDGKQKKRIVKIYSKRGV